MGSVSAPGWAQVSNDMSLADRLAEVMVRRRPRIAHLVSRFCSRISAGPMETAETLSRDTALASKLIRIANTVQQGAGIPVTSIAAATMRLGTERTQALGICFEVADLISDCLGKRWPGSDGFWQACLARGCVARAAAMHVSRRLARDAFLTGFLQDIGQPLIAAAHPEEYSAANEQCGGCPIQASSLMWTALRTNHIHIAKALVSHWRAPTILSDAICRHHTRPPMSAASGDAMRLWQIAHAASVLPFGESDLPDFYRIHFVRLANEAFGMKGHMLFRLISEAREEFAETAPLFSGFDPRPISAERLFKRALESVGAKNATPRSGLESPGRSVREISSPTAIPAGLGMFE